MERRSPGDGGPLSNTIARYLLISVNKQIAARKRAQVADHGSFEVDTSHWDPISWIK